eukprot:scaffold137931_cov84-Phaeocystis_antarctica.AAC.1
MEERLANETKLRQAMEERNAAALEAIRQFVGMVPPSPPTLPPPPPLPKAQNAPAVCGNPND